MIIPGPLEMKNSTQNTPPWQFSELYHLCNNNLKNDLFASPLVEKLHACCLGRKKLARESHACCLFKIELNQFDAE